MKSPLEENVFFGIFSAFLRVNAPLGKCYFHRVIYLLFYRYSFQMSQRDSFTVCLRMWFPEFPKRILL